MSEEAKKVSKVNSIISAVGGRKFFIVLAVFVLTVLYAKIGVTIEMFKILCGVAGAMITGAGLQDMLTGGKSSLGAKKVKLQITDFIGSFGGKKIVSLFMWGAVTFYLKDKMAIPQDVYLYFSGVIAAFCLVQGVTDGVTNGITSSLVPNVEGLIKKVTSRLEE